MRKQSTRRQRAKQALFFFWIAVIVIAVWLAWPRKTAAPSTVAPDAATGTQIMSDVGSGQALQGSDLPLDMTSPQTTAKPN